jgi:hypothetical protein
VLVISAGRNNWQYCHFALDASRFYKRRIEPLKLTDVSTPHPVDEVTLALLYVTIAVARHPVLDAVANKVVAK